MADTMQNKIMYLRQDIMNCRRHIFGNHEECSDYYCKKKKETDHYVDLENSMLMEHVKKALQFLSDRSGSLLLKEDNNLCENFNSLINKTIGGKRVNFGQRGSYNARVAASVVAKNTTRYFRLLNKKLTGYSPGLHTKKFQTRRDKIRQKVPKKRRLNFSDNALNGRQKKRRTEAVGADESYGAVIDDISPEELQGKKDEALAALQLTEEELAQLEVDTRAQSDCPLWTTERKKRLTASNFGKIINMRETTSVKNTIFYLLYNDEIKSKALDHGRMYEPVARSKFCEEFGKEVTLCGLIVDSHTPFLAASPDGVVNGEDSLIEIKCPYAAYESPSFEEAIAAKKLNNCKVIEGRLTLKRNSPYYYQVQGQLNIANKSLCYFVVFAKEWMSVETISRDRDLWTNTMLPKLTRFYKDALLPELVCPMYPLHWNVQDIREASFHKKAK